MAEVGILNLEIKDNSQQAANGLGSLVAKLVAIKRACEGFTMSNVARQIERIAEATNKHLDDTTISRIDKFATAMSKLNGLGDIKIDLKGADRITKTLSTIENTHKKIEQISNTGGKIKDTVGESLFEVSKVISTANKEIQDYYRSVEDFSNKRISFDRIDPKNLPFDKLGTQLDKSSQAWSQYGDMVRDSFETIRNGGMLDSVRGIREVGQSVNAIIPYNENLERTWDGIVRKIEETMEAARRLDQFNQEMTDRSIRMGQEMANKYYGAPETFEEILFGSRTAGAGKKDLLSQWLQGKGTQLEQNYAFNYMSREFGMSVDEVKQKVQELLEMAEKAAEAFDTMNNSIGQSTDIIAQMSFAWNGAREFFQMFQMWNDARMGASLEGQAPLGLPPGYIQGEGTVSAFQEVKETIDENGNAADRATEKFKNLDKELRQKKTDAHGVAAAFNNLKKGITTLFKPITRLVSQFARIVRYRIIRSIIRSITQGFREGTEHVYEYSKAIGSTFHESMDAAASSLATMKNALGASIAPLLQMLIPYLQQVVNWFINLLNYANQFFALLNGQATWTRALPATATAFGKQEKAAKGAAAAVKDLLADWDELNIIQSETSGAGSGAGTSAAEDYLNMFEEVGEFDNTIKKITDFMKDNAGDMLDMVKKAGLALLAWRFSNAFTGVLGTLSSLAMAGLVMDIQWKLTGLLDKQFLKTGEDGWLVAEVIENMVGAGLVGLGVGRVLGVEGGLIAVGIDFAVSGGISYGIALANEENDKAKVLKDLGIVKGVLGDLFLMAGFTIISGPAGLLLGAAAGSIMFGLAAAYTVVAEQVNTAKEIAEAAFTASHEGSISVEEIFNELQTELDKRTSGYGLIINAFSNVSELKNNLKGAFGEIQQLTNVIRSDEALTQDEAERFKAAWETVFSAFEGITKDSFNTVFEALNKSLADENEIIRNEAKELRVSLLMIEENMSEASARFKEKMMGLADKVATGTATKEEIDQYLAYVEEMSQASGKTMRTLQETVEEGTRVDFKNKTDIDDFVTKVNDEMVSAIDEINTGEKTALDALNEIRLQQEMLHRVGEIGDAEYNAAMIVFDKTEENIKKAAEDNRKSVKSSVQDAYNIILESALKGMDEIPLDNEGRVDVLSAYQYMLDYIEPIVAAIIDAGGDVNDDLKKAFQIGVDPSEAISESFNSLLEGKVDTPLLNYLRSRYKLIVDEAMDEPIQAEAPDIEIKEGVSHPTDLGEIKTTVDGIKVAGDWDKLKKEFDDQVREALGTSTLKVGTDVVGIVSDINQMVNRLTRKQSEDMTGMEVAKPTVSFVGATPYDGEPVQVTNSSSDPFAVTIDRQSNAESTAEGVQKGNAAVVDAINILAGLVRSIQNKEFVINLNPTSSLGKTVNSSSNAYDLVVGR